MHFTVGVERAVSEPALSSSFSRIGHVLAHNRRRMIGSLLAVLVLSKATAADVSVPGPAGALGGTLTLPARGRRPSPPWSP